MTHTQTHTQNSFLHMNATTLIIYSRTPIKIYQKQKLFIP